jgi:hypothetical protein
MTTRPPPRSRSVLFLCPHLRLAARSLNVVPNTFHDYGEIETTVTEPLGVMAARLSPGAISESSSSHLPPSEAFVGGEAGDVPIRPVKPGAMPPATGSPACRKDDRDRPRLPLKAAVADGRVCQDGSNSHFDI